MLSLKLGRNVKGDPMGFERQCQGCDSLGQVNDIGLCSECTAKMDRDMIRQRAWDYSVTGVLLAGREKRGIA